MFLFTMVNSIYLYQDEILRVEYLTFMTNKNQNTNKDAYYEIQLIHQHHFGQPDHHSHTHIYTQE